VAFAAGSAILAKLAQADPRQRSSSNFVSLFELSFHARSIREKLVAVTRRLLGAVGTTDSTCVVAEAVLE
jgi:hypothetical protein